MTIDICQSLTQRLGAGPADMVFHSSSNLIPSNHASSNEVVRENPDIQDLNNLVQASQQLSGLNTRFFARR